jgi:hypothetical protein
MPEVLERVDFRVRCGSGPDRQGDQEADRGERAKLGVDPACREGPGGSVRATGRGGCGSAARTRSSGWNGMSSSDRSSCG